MIHQDDHTTGHQLRTALGLPAAGRVIEWQRWGTALPSPTVLAQVGAVGPYRVRSAGVDGTSFGSSADRILCDDDPATALVVDSYLGASEVFANNVHGYLETGSHDAADPALTGATWWALLDVTLGGAWVSSIQFQTAGAGTVSYWDTTMPGPVLTTLGWLYPLDKPNSVKNAMNGYAVDAVVSVKAGSKEQHTSNIVRELYAVAIVAGTEL